MEKHKTGISCLKVFIHNRLPEDEPTGSKHVEHKKKLIIKLLI